MKKFFLIFLFTLLGFTNVNSQIMETFLKDDAKVYRQLELIPVLINKKITPQELLKTYNDPVQKRKRAHFSWPSTFNQQDADKLIEQTKADTLIKYWTKKEMISFGMDDITEGDKFNVDKLREINEKHMGYVILYSLSEPLLTNKGQNAIFLVVKSGVWPQTPIIEYATVVMKKENNTWVIAEKIYSSMKFN